MVLLLTVIAQYVKERPRQMHLRLFSAAMNPVPWEMAWGSCTDSTDRGVANPLVKLPALHITAPTGFESIKHRKQYCH